jgi:hypothetical protein
MHVATAVAAIRIKRRICFSSLDSPRDIDSHRPMLLRQVERRLRTDIGETLRPGVSLRVLNTYPIDQTDGQAQRVGTRVALARALRATIHAVSVQASVPPCSPRTSLRGLGHCPYPRTIQCCPARCPLLKLMLHSAHSGQTLPGYPAIFAAHENLDWPHAKAGGAAWPLQRWRLADGVCERMTSLRIAK